MAMYCAFLGHQPHISIAELKALLPDMQIRNQVEKHIVLFETESDIDQIDFDHWGGTIVLGREIVSSNVELADIPKILHREVEGFRGKVTFGLRTIGLSKKLIKQLYRACKEKLRSENIASRYVGNERQPAAPILLHDAELIDGKKGCELIVIVERRDDEAREQADLWIGRTVAAQDPDFYSFRDMKKPIRDTKTGLLPPKLAQILLNLGEWLAQKHIGKECDELTIYDPFCGTGVIPMESLLRGWDVFASDKAKKAVEATERNLNWLRKEEEISKDIESEVFQHNATRAFEDYLADEVDVVVTETSLGPPLRKRLTLQEAKKLRSENEMLQKEFLENAAQSLPDVPIVCTWPVWYLRSGPVFLEKIWKTVENQGFQPVLPEGIAPSMESRMSLLYRRKDQLVGREIICLLPQ